MSKTARYIIILDRLDPEQDYRADKHTPDGHDGTALAACIQVANELQQAMDVTGLPAGFFRVIDRHLIDPEFGVVEAHDNDALAAMLGLKRYMEDGQ